MICKICKKTGFKNLNLHLFHAHDGLSAKEYAKKYDAETIEPETKSKLGRNKVDDILQIRNELNEKDRQVFDDLISEAKLEYPGVRLSKLSSFCYLQVCQRRLIAENEKKRRELPRQQRQTISQSNRERVKKLINVLENKMTEMAKQAGYTGPPLRPTEEKLYPAKLKQFGPPPSDEELSKELSAIEWMLQSDERFAVVSENVARMVKASK